MKPLRVTLGLLTIWMVCAGFQPETSDKIAKSTTRDIYREMLVAINAERTKEGLAPLEIDEKLNEACGWMAEDVSTFEKLSHTDSRGRTPDVRADEAGYDWGFIAENICGGAKTPKEAVELWMKSKNHRKNMLSPQAKHLGVGYYFRPKSKSLSYWVVLFGATR